MVNSTDSKMAVSRYQVGDLIVDLVRREVLRGQDILPVKGLSFELLACLVRHYPDLATMKQINDEVWGENVVTPAALSQRVKLLREGLGSTEEFPGYLEVVKSRGYQLVVPVEPLENAQVSRPSKITAFMVTLAILLLMGTLVFIAIEGVHRGSELETATQTSAPVSTVDGEDTTQTANQLNVSEEAFDLYRRATYHGRAYSVPEIQKGIQLLDRALELEPQFAEALGSRAMLYAFSGTPSYGWMSPNEAFKHAREDALRAIALKPDLDWAQVVLGDILFWHEWNVPAAEQAYRSALQSNPQSTGARFSLALLRGTLGHHEEAITLVREAIDIEPLRSGSYTNLAWRLIGARQFEGAITAANRALELEPGMLDASLIKIWAHTYLGQHEQAVELVRTMEPNAATAYALAEAGLTEEARAILIDLMDKPEGEDILADEIATVQVGLGDYDSALDWLEKAIEQRSRSMLFIEITQLWDPLRNHPRYETIKNSVGIWPETSVTN